MGMNAELLRDAAETLRHPDSDSISAPNPPADESPATHEKYAAWLEGLADHIEQI